MKSTKIMDTLKLKCGTFGLHVIKNPAGTFSFVGSIPVELSDSGDIVTGYHFPVFETEQDAIEYINKKMTKQSQV